MIEANRVLVKQDWVLRLLCLVIIYGTLIHHLLLTCLLIHDFFVLQIDVEHDQLLILVDKVLRLVTGHVNAQCIIESIFEWVRSSIVTSSHATTSFDLRNIACHLLRSNLALTIFDEKSIYVKFLVEEGKDGRAHSFTIDRLALALFEELEGHFLVVSHNLPVVTELLAKLRLVVSSSAIHFLLINALIIRKFENTISKSTI